MRDLLPSLFRRQTNSRAPFGWRRTSRESTPKVLSLGIIKGSTIDLIADGTDEKDAVDALVELISSDFAD